MGGIVSLCSTVDELTMDDDLNPFPAQPMGLPLLLSLNVWPKPNASSSSFAFMPQPVSMRISSGPAADKSGRRMSAPQLVCWCQQHGASRGKQATLGTAV